MFIGAYPEGSNPKEMLLHSRASPRWDLSPAASPDRFRNSSSGTGFFFSHPSKSHPCQTLKYLLSPASCWDLEKDRMDFLKALLQDSWQIFHEMLLKSSSWSIWPSDILSLPGQNERSPWGQEGHKGQEKNGGKWEDKITVYKNLEFMKFRTIL